MTESTSAGPTSAPKAAEPKAAPAAQKKQLEPGGARGSLAAIQQAAGNQAVQRLFAQGAIQAQVAVGPPGDPFEQEADRVADAVVGGKPAGCSCGGTCEKCRAAGMGIRRKANGGAAGSGGGPSSVAGNPLSSLGAGRAMDRSSNSFFSNRMGSDFSGVRLHTGPAAEQSAASINARAYTYGNSVVFGKGAYDPGSKEGKHTLAHELTHVVQQGQGARPAIRRQDHTTQEREASDQQGNETPEDGWICPAPSLTEQESSQLNKLIGTERVYDLIERRDSMRRYIGREQMRGMGIIALTTQNRTKMAQFDRDIESGLAELGFANERALYQYVHDELPASVLAVAETIALDTLRQNEERARAEMERYSEAVCTPDTEGLFAADRELGQRYGDIQVLEHEINQASMYASGISGGPTPSDPAALGIPQNEGSIMYVMHRLDEYRENLELKMLEYEQVRSIYGIRFPVLLSQGYEPGKFESSPRDQLATLTAEPLQEIIDNIEDVRDAIREDEFKVWELRDVINLAMLQMEVADKPIYVNAVRSLIESKQGDDTIGSLFLTATALITTVVAGALTGGVGVPVVAAAWGTYFLSESLSEYFRESAAENVAMNPDVRDISLNEPTLLWVALDIAFLGYDIGPAIRAVRPYARAAMRTCDIGAFARAVRGIVPEAADRLVRSLRRRLGRRALDEGATGAAAREVLGQGKTLDEYLAALRSETHGSGSIGRAWDYNNQPRGLPSARWEPGFPIDMPNKRGTYPGYSAERYWRNRAHYELQARRQGTTARRPGATNDPVAAMTDQELGQLRNTGKSPGYAYANRPGGTWELEHVGTPQRVGKSLRELGFNQPGESSRLIGASSPGSLMEVTPLEHAFFDEAAWRFGQQRADVAGRMLNTAGTDIRIQRPLYYMPDDTIQQIVREASARGMDFSRTARTRELRGALITEIAERGLGISVP